MILIPNDLPFNEDVNQALHVVYNFLRHYAREDYKSINRACTEISIYGLSHMADILVADMFKDWPPIKELKEEFLILLTKSGKEVSRSDSWHRGLIISSCIIKIRNSMV